MSTQVNITTIISGTSPYDIWICDKCDTTGTCQYINTFTNAQLPFSFTLPAVYETYPSFVIKIIDDNKCEYCYDTALVFKEFMNGDEFDFMNDQRYEFQ